MLLFAAIFGNRAWAISNWVAFEIDTVFIIIIVQFAVFMNTVQFAALFNSVRTGKIIFDDFLALWPSG